MRSSFDARTNHYSSLEASEQPSAPTPASTIFSIGCPLAAFLIPLKLSLAYAVLAPLIALWIVSLFTRRPSHLLAYQERSILIPLFLFFLSCIISSFVGINFSRGLSALISLLFFACTIMVFLRHAPLIQTASAIIAGQSIAALHTFLEASLSTPLAELFQGKVTESGQLAVSVVVAIGLMWHFANISRDQKAVRHRIASGCALFILLLALSFGSRTFLGTLPMVLLILLTAALSLYSIRHSLRAAGAAQRVDLLASVQLPLLCAALFINLKRGPWLGTMVGTAIFFAFYARRMLVALLAAACLSILTLAPIRDRIAASYEHFTISGGRSTMWRIALDLASEYPLGIGYHNSGIIRTLAPEIPTELKHFHNNFLNILAETGWLGAAFFVWFIVALVQVCFSDRRNMLAVGTGCAIVSWQAAGLVEYNIGDSEVLILVWMLVGSLLYSLRTTRPSAVLGEVS